MKKGSRRDLKLEDLPEDPTTMPPPYWRSSGACFHINESLINILRQLKRLAPLLERVEVEMAAFYRDHPTESAQEKAKDMHWRIASRPIYLEHQIKLNAEVACLMSAIEAEDNVNCFCVYNLHKHVAEGIERLPLPDKLLIACTSVGAPEVKGTNVYESAKKLVAWRNAFAHGHCVDRPVKSLRHNHLISPSEYPGVPSAVRDTASMVSAYLEIADYLRKKSKNEYTGGVSGDDEDMRHSITKLSAYAFVGTNQHYKMTAPKSAKKAKH